MSNIYDTANQLERDLRELEWRPGNIVGAEEEE